MAKEIRIESIVGMMTKEPLVQVTIGDEKILITPAEARDVALNLFECSEAAIMDLCVTQFMTDKVGADMETAGMMLAEFRKWREEYIGPARLG